MQLCGSGQQQHIVGVEEENQVVGGGTARIEVRREQRDLAAQTPPGLAEAQHGQLGAESFHGGAEPRQLRPLARRNADDAEHAAAGPQSPGLDAQAARVIQRRVEHRRCLVE